MPKIKVAFISRDSLFNNPGGDLIQMQQTQSELLKLGVSVDILLCSQIFDPSQYDILHFHNLNDPNNITHLINKHNKCVISTIYVDYFEVNRKIFTGFKYFITRIFDKYKIEYLKVIMRRLINGEKIKSKYYLFFGHKKSIQYALNKTSYLFPNSESEFKRILKDFNYKGKYKVIPNGVNEIFTKQLQIPKTRNMVLCVGRIEPLKNQLNLIQAVKNTSFQLFIIGKAGTNSKAYYQDCLRHAGDNVTFINHISSEELVQYYAKAEIHALCSIFETTGLVHLEAAVQECKIVATRKGDQEDYLKDWAFYADPDNVDDIKKTLIEASNAVYNPELKNYILNHYRWDLAAKILHESYIEILS